MNREFGPATIYVGDKVIGECKIESMNIEQEVHDYEEVKMNYEGEVEMEVPPEYIKQMQAAFGMPERDKRIKSRLGRVFKSVHIPPRVYSKISDSLNKLGVRK